MKLTTKLKRYHQLGHERGYRDAKKGMFGSDLLGILEDYETCLSGSEGIPVGYLKRGRWGLDEYWREIMDREPQAFKPDEYRELQDTGCAYLKGWCEGARRYLKDGIIG